MSIEDEVSHLSTDAALNQFAVKVTMLTERAQALFNADPVLHNVGTDTALSICVNIIKDLLTDLPSEKQQAYMSAILSALLHLSQHLNGEGL